MANSEPERPAGVPADARWEAGRWRTGRLVDGRPVGEWRTYSPKGVLVHLQTFDALGRPDGPYEQYYPDGTLWKRGEMKDGGQADGVHECFAPASVDPTKTWSAFGSAVAGVITRVVGRWTRNKWAALEYFDAEGHARGPRGRVLDAAPAKKRKAARPARKTRALAKKR